VVVLVLAGLVGCVEPNTPPSLADGGSDGGIDAGFARPDGGSPPEDLDGFIEWHMERGGIPGLAAAIVDADGARWTGLYGYADVEREIAVSDDTIFTVASISKPVATATLLQSVEAGRIDLDAPLDEYAGFAVRHPEHLDRAITLREVLTHTTGLVDDFGILVRATSMGDSEIPIRTFIEGYVTPGGEYYDDDNWGAEPGTEYSYCNAAFAFVGEVVDQTEAQDFREVSHTGLLEPLGMWSSTWTLAETDSAHLAVPYTWSRASGFAPLSHSGYAYYTASSFRTSVTDLGRFLRMLIRRGELDGNRVLSEKTVAAIETVQFPDVQDDQGITLEYDRVNGRSYIGHSGSTSGGSAQMLYRTDERVGFLMLTNSDAYVQARLGNPQGRDALTAILQRIEREIDAR
jgi:CubicO group peptidase (beta-lactamase class C family)